MKVAVVCPYDLSVSGGVQQLTRELTERLLAVGEDASLVGPGGDERGAVGDSVSIRANRSQVPVALDPRAYFATRRLLAAADVVHVHEPLIPLVGWAALRAGPPVVATFHADPARWTRRLYRLGALPATGLLGAARLTAVSEVAASAIPASWGPLEVIPNAIDAASYRLDVPRQPTRVAFLGRDDPRKGLDVALAAWPSVLAENPHAEFLAMGPDRTIEDPSVSVLGRVDEDEKREILASASVFVAPNLGGESFGIVVAEAMAAGCAVVASDLPAFRSVVGDAGILVPPGDVRALAAAVIDLLADPTRASTLGTAARKAATRFDWKAVVGAYRRVYESALEGT